MQWIDYRVVSKLDSHKVVLNLFGDIFSLFSFGVFDWKVDTSTIIWNCAIKADPTYNESFLLQELNCNHCFGKFAVCRLLWLLNYDTTLDWSEFFCLENSNLDECHVNFCLFFFVSERLCDKHGENPLKDKFVFWNFFPKKWSYLKILKLKVHSSPTNKTHWKQPSRIVWGKTTFFLFMFYFKQMLGFGYVLILDIFETQFDKIILDYIH